MQRFVELFKKHNEICVIETPLDIYLEIPHLAYLEAKKPNGGKALLFTNPIDKKNNKQFKIPVLMNIFGSKKRIELIIQNPIEEIQKKILQLLDFKPPKNFYDIRRFLKNFLSLRHIFPIKKNIFFPFKHKYSVMKDNEVDLYKFPILTTWEHDAAPFITMGQIYTQSLDGSKKNLGMYRLQVFDKKHLGLHWQIHKDSQHFFYEYQKANKKMPVSIALGGDPLYTWCGQAPLPYGIYELMLYGFIRNKNARVKKCLTNPLYVPCDVDIIIEGWVDPNLLKLEGPFGDHTGFYTPVEKYPVLEVSAIVYKNNPIFPATVVGKPPIEDKYMGYFTERVFLPLLQRTAHGLLDIYMPENGVFHNLILAKIETRYPAHAKQIMHNFWGVGQMSFVKHAIFLDSNAPDFCDTENLMMYLLNRFDVENIIISEGVCDALDHASPDFAFGGKLGIDATGCEVKRDFKLLNDCELLQQMHLLLPEVVKIRQYYVDSNSPICIVGINKQCGGILNKVANIKSLLSSLAIVVFVDSEKNDLNNPYMLVWRITNNIDAKRDIKIVKKTLFIDATDKNEADGHFREWPKETDCNIEVLRNLKEMGLLQYIDDKFLHHYHICNSPQEDIKCRL